MSFKPSKYQAAIFDAVLNDNSNIMIEAVAGAGKTTTGLEATKRMKNATIYFGCFGAPAAEDIAKKANEKGYAKEGLSIGTMHSAGFAAWRAVWPKVRVDDRKVSLIIKKMAADESLGADNQMILQMHGELIAKLANFGKGVLMGVKDADPRITRNAASNNYAVWRKLADHHGLLDALPEDITDEAITDIMKMVSIVFEKSAAMCREIIDFADMLYAPIRFNARFFKYDWVIGDEWQDANRARRVAAKRMIGKGGRAMFFGDQFQCIFGFTGASTDSLALTSKDFNCLELSMPVTYRCPKAVVGYVKQWVPHIEAAEGANEGIVRTYAPKEGDSRPWFVQNPPLVTDAILCRYNAPLIKTAFAMLSHGIACKVEGRDIGKNLIELATRWNIKSLDALDGRLDKYLATAISKAQAKEDEQKEQAENDKVEALRIFIKRCRDKGDHTVDCVVEEIKAIFADKVTGVVTLCSGHKAKGREWGGVFWIQTPGRNKRPLKPWQQKEEINLCYVIGTRVEGATGRGELVLIPEGTI